jgi:transcription elongation factor Elf1
MRFAIGKYRARAMGRMYAQQRGRIARRPWWTRRRCSCPQCGQIISHVDAQRMENAHQFECSRCGAKMSMVDFWNFHQDKTSILADLSQESNAGGDV